MKKLKWVIAFLIFVCLAVYFGNLFLIQMPVQKRLKVDSRNDGIKLSIHLKNYVDLKTLTFNIAEITGSKAPADVFRTFLVSSSVLKGTKFNKVELASKGKLKFYISGDYFNTLGNEYGDQNVVYTIRTFPENTFLPDGTSAYDSWTGGMLGVLSKQMDDFNNLCHAWFIEDF